MSDIRFSQGVVPIISGGTGAVNAPAARVNLNIDQRRTFSNADVTVLSTDRYVAQVGTMSAPRVVTLPLANSVNAGQSLKIVDESGTVTTTNLLTITAAGSDTIDGSASKTVRSAYGEADLVSNGSNMWFRPVTGIGAGGTGLGTTPTDGQLLIGNSSTSSYVQSTLTAGTGVTITNAGGSITLSSSNITATTTKTANYTILSTDSTIFCDTNTVGAFTLTLPSPSGLAGKMYRIIDTKGTFGTNNLTLARSAAELIEGVSASKVLQTNWGWFQVTTNGTDWFVGQIMSKLTKVTFNASGSITIPAGITNILVTGRGGSGGGGGGAGGGGGSTATPARGGGGGSSGGATISRNIPLVVTPGTTYTITIGAAGTLGTGGAGAVANAAGATGTAGNNGGNGGNSTFDTLWTFYGGAAGQGGSAGSLAAAGTGATAAATREIAGNGAGGTGGVSNGSSNPGGNGSTNFFGLGINGGSGGTSGVNIGGGGGGAAGSNGGDASATGTAAAGGNGGNGADGSAGGTAPSQAANAGAGGSAGAAGGGGGIVAVTGSNGGAGSDGTVGNVGQIIVQWVE